MAELFLILLFLLLFLLAIASIAREQEKKELAETWERERTELAERVTLLDERLRNEALPRDELAALVSLREAIQKSGWAIEEIETLVEGVKRLAELEREQASLVKVAEVARAIQGVADEAGVSLDAVMQVVLGLPSEFYISGEADRVLDANAKIAAAEKELSTVKLELEKALSHLKQAEDQTALAEAAVEQLAAVKGIDPSCWYTYGSESKPEVVYLFDVAIFSTWLIIRDRPVPAEFADAKKRLPLDGIEFDQPLTNSEFLNATTPILRAGKDRLVHEAWACVFFVAVFDETAPDEKERYKRAEDVIGASFYTTRIYRAWAN